MTRQKALRILGLPSNATKESLKRTYRQLVRQVHPDSFPGATFSFPYSVQEIIAAYTYLRDRLPSEASSPNPYNNQEEPHTDARFRNGPSQNTRRNGSTAHTDTESAPSWNAPINQYAYAKRDILHYAEDSSGSVIGSFCIARGKYLWTTEEDFSLFLLSIYRCSKQILDAVEISMTIPSGKTPKKREYFHAQLSYLLAQQFMDGTTLLKELASSRQNTSGQTIFYLSAMLEFSGSSSSVTPGEALLPAGVRDHRLYLKNKAGKELGYLSFPDDRLYYVVIPLLEQKKVLVKIQAADAQLRRSGKGRKSYQHLHLWLKFDETNPVSMPENLNLQIQNLLRRYREGGL